jgi:hypothetical protein
MAALGNLQERPVAYLQPDPKRDCGFYATAYIARCLGHPEITAQDVMAWRASTGRHEDWYLDAELGITAERFAVEPAEHRRIWWLGPDAQEWVQGWLDRGWIGKAEVHRVPHMVHGVVVLGYSANGVELMDPLTGFVTESWEWFLGVGSGVHGCHHIGGWYR